MHQRERLAQPRRDEAGIARRQLQPISDLRQQLRRRGRILGIEGEANVTAGEPVLVLGVEPVHRVRLADPGHARNHHRPALAVLRKQIGGKLLQIRLAADEHILDPRVRARRRPSQATRLALLRRQRLGLAEHRLQHAWLGGQQPAQTLVILLVIDDETGSAFHRRRDVVGRAIREQHGDEPGADRAGVVEELADDARLPKDAMSDARRLLAVDPAQIGFGTHQQHETGRLDPPLAPRRPTLGRRGFVLVDLGVDAVFAQPVGKIENPILVRLAVVAVADEDLRRGRHVPSRSFLLAVCRIRGRGQGTGGLTLGLCEPKAKQSSLDHHGAAHLAITERCED